MLEIGKNSNSIHWVTKSKGYMRIDGDIQINVAKYTVAGVDKRQASIIMRNNQHKKFKSGYITFGIAGSRLYMMDADANTGYKLTSGSNSYTRYIRVSDDTLTDWCKNHIGSYVLDFDTTQNLYYIETNEGEC